MSRENILDLDTYNGAPQNEPERQYYFIQRIREIIDFYKKKEGREFTACITTFGCQMNSRDSEKISGILTEAGYKLTENELEADFVLFNTCTIRENANEHLYGRLGRLKQVKKKNPEMVIAICGCMMQEADEVLKMRTKYPYVDLIFGTHNFYMFAELYFELLAKRSGIYISAESSIHEMVASSDNDLHKAEKLKSYDTKKNKDELIKLSTRPVVSVWKDNEDIVEELPSLRKFPFKQGVNIMFGCNNFCSYCIVPYVRGREKSRLPEEIIKEVKKLGEDGVKEIMLLGQNVNSYGKNLETPMTFAELLKLVDEEAGKCGIERIRFMTSHPKDLSDELIEVMKNGKHICRQFHLPLQSGSSKILKRMNRHYDREGYMQRVYKLKEAMPDISISTDIIVGFPGEKEEDFNETLEVVREVEYDSAFTFIYSKRLGTPAASYDDQIDEEAVKKRFDRLLEVQNEIAEKNCIKLLNKELPVLFEEVNQQDNSLITGRLENNALVHVRGNKELIGTIKNVKLTQAHGFYYTGEII